jgi:ubiquinone/menaquinone biosynthesis C-methylase UbiE
MSDLLADERLVREREFHDQLAADLDPAQMPPGPLNVLDAAMVDAVGEMKGRRVLDLGCGSGDLTVLLALAGAHVTGVDLSPGMISVAKERTERFAPTADATFAAAPAEELPLADGSVDVILGRFILHHLDIPRAAKECARVLAPGGKALFVENSGRNPILMFSRSHLAGRFGIPRYGTADERPLSQQDLAALREHLPELQLEYPVFDFFAIFDRQVLRHRWRLGTRMLRGLDRLIWRWLPVARPWSFRVLVVSGA